MSTLLLDDICRGIETTDLKPIRLHLSAKARKQLYRESDRIFPIDTVLGIPIVLDRTLANENGVGWKIVQNDAVTTKLESERWQRGLLGIADRWRKCDTPADRSKAEALEIASRELRTA